jgi:major vault protein
VYERVVAIVDSYIITDRQGIRLRALRTFTDKYGKTRRNGAEWLITIDDTESHIPGVYEEVVGVVDLTVLTNRQYAVIEDPYDDDGKQVLGAQRLIKGPASFFLRPGEEVPSGIQDFHILGDDEGLILRAVQAFEDTVAGKAVRRTPGDRWMVKGPCEYVPPVTVEVVETRKAIPLDDNEGVYVRDTQTGKVRAVIGMTYMLTENEELWAKEMPDVVEALLSRAGSQVKGPHIVASKRGAGGPTGPARVKSRVIEFRVPHNGAVQVYDYKQKKSRVVFGPDMVMLGPDEQFTQLSLSGGKPKKPNEIQSLCLLMGPDFCTDIIQIETADHARLQLQLSYVLLPQCSPPPHVSYLLARSLSTAQPRSLLTCTHRT